MTPKQIENLIYRMCGRSNVKGLPALRKLNRFGLDREKHNNVFDCDARAEIACRYAREDGWTAKTAVQYDPGMKQPHRYVILYNSKTGERASILKVKMSLGQKQNKEKK